MRAIVLVMTLATAALLLLMVMMTNSSVDPSLLHIRHDLSVTKSSLYFGNFLPP